MKYAIITDQHFCVRGSSQYFINQYRKFYSEVFFPKLDEENIKLIICLGDTWEDRKMLNVSGIKAAKEMYFDEAQKRGIKIITIIGNHDVYYRNTNSVNSMDFLEHTYDNIEVIYENTVLDLDGFKLALCSWINKENYETQLKFIETAEADVLGGHFEINGFEMTRGNVCESGFKPEIFKRFNEVWSGHFHIKSMIDYIHYLGNPFQTNKGDIGYERGFHIHDTDTRILTFVKNPFEIYVRHQYDENMDINEFDYEQYRDKHVFIDITSMLRIDSVKFNTFKDKLNVIAWGAEVVEHEFTNSDGEVVVDVDYKSNIEIINNYIEVNYSNDEDRSELMYMMDELHNEALNLRED